jgi:hypothetical protein
MSSRLLWALILCAAAVVPLVARAQKPFPSPDAAASALVSALKADEEPALRAILGRRGFDLIDLRPQPQEERRHERFLSAYAVSNRLVPLGNAKVVLEVGEDGWPFPIPLVKSDAGWRFDPQLGEREVLARRIGRNELTAIEVCLAIGDAQREYASSQHDNDNVLKYSPRFASTPQKHDGLYWESAPDEPLSPLGPFVAAAGVDRGSAKVSLEREPYYGYFYRILVGQGKHAKGGTYSYVAHGRMIGGFAVLAFPAHYGSSGVKTFMVSQDGEVFEKDLGPNTASLAQKIQSFDPDPSWTRSVASVAPPTQR